MRKNPGGYGCYEQWATQSRYILSDTDSDVYLHFQITMRIGTDNYAVKLDNFVLSQETTLWTDVSGPTTTFTDVAAPTTTFTDVTPVTTDWSDV